MELLINALLKRGARRDRLQAKLFGGGRMIANMTNIGAQNGAFAVKFLADERHSGASRRASAATRRASCGSGRPPGRAQQMLLARDAALAEPVVAPPRPRTRPPEPWPTVGSVLTPAAPRAVRTVARSDGGPVPVQRGRAHLPLRPAGERSHRLGEAELMLDRSAGRTSAACASAALGRGNLQIGTRWPDGGGAGPQGSAVRMKSLDRKGAERSATTVRRRRPRWLPAAVDRIRRAPGGPHRQAGSEQARSCAHRLSRAARPVSRTERRTAPRRAGSARPGRAGTSSAAATKSSRDMSSRLCRTRSICCRSMPTSGRQAVDAVEHAVQRRLGAHRHLRQIGGFARQTRQQLGQHQRRSSVSMFKDAPPRARCSPSAPAA